MNSVSLPPETASTREVNTRATAFLERREFDAWSEQDETELNAWLGEAKAHCAAFWRLEAAWERTHRLAALTFPKPGRTLAEPHVRFAPVWLRVAAGAAVIAMLGIASGLYALWPRDTLYETPVGGRQTIALVDGSQIELNTNTALRARVTGDHRAVTLLRGEAYFRIKHDAAHPFIVIASGDRVTDLGTAFTVRNDPNRVRVTLLEGSARFESNGSSTRQKSVVLVPGDSVIATAVSTSVSRKSPQMLATELGWRRGVVIFKHTTLAEVAAEFDRYNTLKLVIADPETAHLTVGGTFPANNVELFSRMATAILGLHVSKQGDAIVISRRSTLN